ncbi:P-loop containing nucleoside triphosphate hydrolase protein [Piedraia hortae CBS 480.64]|uniref:P-loop containing nucleoside triphosphate hydrolase protein n=1 Tax=Piedraia hortae CBS 480.64 TaxID=1314780 RepID=A0A6A7C4S2_9PEZI|nr:P-loop containing nucleoside triphosphate hydrolase protein [Piedraia hortae CBS 480.64]
MVGQFTLRSYQQEMFEESLRRNIIVVMDTGSGKTHIAIARIIYEVEHGDPNKLIWFMAPSITLCFQQYHLLKDNLGACNILTLTGADNVDKWTEKRLWDAVLKNIRVVVGTPAVLKDALSHSFVHMSRLGLLVFDECHHCTKENSMNNIMKLFYHHSKDKGEHVPHILGLSASPVMRSTLEHLQISETNLDAIARTPRREKSELDKFIHQPIFHKVKYAAGPISVTPGLIPLYDRIQMAYVRYDLNTDPYMVALGQNGSLPVRRRRLWCQEYLRGMCNNAKHLLEQLGSYSAKWYLESCISRIKNKSLNQGVVFDINMKEQLHLRNILCVIDQEPRPAMPTQVADKAKKLLTLLAGRNAAKDRGIVFVKQRVIVPALVELLRQAKTEFNVGGFVGTSTYSSKRDVEDFTDLKQFDRDLEGFRHGDINLMVATSVLEEGIDVPACNLIISFDPAPTVVSFVQRRGRARHKLSTYIEFQDELQRKSNIDKWQGFAERIKQMAMSERRKVDVVDVDEKETRICRVEKTGALLTLSTAKGHLYHFCQISKSEAASNTELQPEFVSSRLDDTVTVRGEMEMFLELESRPQSDPVLVKGLPGAKDEEQKWTAKVTLPAFVDERLREFASSKVWKGKKAAEGDAAMEAYIALYQAGLINDHLLPLIKDRGPDMGEHLDQPSIVDVAMQRNSWALMAKNLTASPQTWHKTTLSIAKSSNPTARGENDRICLSMLLPGPLEERLSFNIPWSEHGRLEVALTPTSEPLLTRNNLQIAQKATYIILSSMYGTRMDESRLNYLVLITPVVTDLSAWVKATEGSLPAAEFTIDPEFATKAGLIRIASEPNIKFILARAPKPNAITLEVKRFKKGSHFLNGDHDDNTSELSTPCDSCTVDRLPVRYASFASVVPSLMYYLDLMMTAQTLQRTVMQDVNIQDTELVFEAIVAPSAGTMVDYNRLEYLGDAILKYAASIQVMAQNPTWPEGYLSWAKHNIICNSTLSQAALNMGLDAFIITDNYRSAKWRPKYVDDYNNSPNEQQTRRMSSKILADVIEALIGVSFVDGGLPKAHQCIRTTLPTFVWLDNPFDPLTSNLGSCEYNPLGLLKTLIGHKFHHPILLLEAITHASTPHLQTGRSYERLEFLGDAVLDLLLTPKLYSHRKRLKHNDMHSIHEALVNGLFLGYCCMTYSISEEVSADLSDLHHITRKRREYHLYDFLRAGGQVMQKKVEAVQRYEKVYAELAQSLALGREYPWVKLMALNPPKFFSDMVEAVLGAVFLDTGGDLETCEVFLNKLGVLEMLRRLLEDNVETMSPKELFGIAAGSESVSYKTTLEEDAHGGRAWRCCVFVNEDLVAEVDGCEGRREAEVMGAEEARRILGQRDSGVGAGEDV